MDLEQQRELLKWMVQYEQEWFGPPQPKNSTRHPGGYTWRATTLTPYFAKLAKAAAFSTDTPFRTDKYSQRTWRNSASSALKELVRLGFAEVVNDEGVKEYLLTETGGRAGLWAS